MHLELPEDVSHTPRSKPGSERRGLSLLGESLVGALLSLDSISNEKGRTPTREQAQGV
jgi:hypothetical protein